MFTTHQYPAVPPHTAVPAHTTLFLVAAILLGLVASNLWGADIGDKKPVPPGLLPAGTAEAAVPMNEARDESFAASAWKAIEQQNLGNWREAATIWRRAAVPDEGEVWRHLSLGVALLNLGDLDLADEQFTLARELDRENAAVHYFTGLLRMKQAAPATVYYDALPPSETRLVDYVPERRSPGSDDGGAKTRRELEAINELETAVTYASRLDLASPLANVRWVVPVPYPMSEAAAPPTVGDLLASLGADNLAGKAHGLLSNLYLGQRQPDQAEYHTDAASSLGVAVPSAYRTAGKLYEARGQDADAFRAYTKAMRQGDGIVAPGAKALRSLGNALGDLF